VLVDERETNQSHLRLHWEAPIDPRDLQQRAALGVYATLLGGSMGSRLFEEIRERRGLCYSVWAHGGARADAASLNAGAGLDSVKCVEAYERIVEIVNELAADGPTPGEVERARAYAAGSLVLALERTSAVASRAADRRITFGEDGSPEDAVDALDAVTEEDVHAIAEVISGTPTVACVGPHPTSDFE
jgi:predicted Zn-dependent peptidase